MSEKDLGSLESGSSQVEHPVTRGTDEDFRLTLLQPPSLSLPQLSKKHGPVFTVHLGPWRRVVVLVGHQAVREALGDQAEEFSGRGMLATLDRTFDGHGESGEEPEAAGSSSTQSLLPPAGT